MNFTKEQLIQKFQKGEKVPIQHYYPVFYPEIQQYIQIKRNSATYKIDDTDWEDLELEVFQGFIYAAEHFDHKKNSDFEGWYKKIIKQYFDRQQNKILKQRIKEQEAIEKLSFSQSRTSFPSEEAKLSQIQKITNLVFKKKSRNPEQTRLALNLFLHFFGYYGPFDSEMEDAESLPKSIEDLSNYYQITDKNRIAKLITTIQRVIIHDDYRKLDEMSLLRRSPLTPLDYKVLEFIIEENQKKNSRGEPVCPNSTDFIKKGRFELDIKSRTTLSDSIRRLKDAGYRFRDKEDRNSNQGYFLLNPELYHSLGISEQVAVEYLEKLLQTQKEGPVKSGISMLLDRILKNYDYKTGSLDDIVKFNSLNQTNETEPLIFEELCNFCKNKSSVAIKYSCNGEIKIVFGTVLSLELNAQGLWILNLSSADKEFHIPVTKVLGADLYPKP